MDDYTDTNADRDLADVAEEMANYVTEVTPETLAIPSSVGDAEAVHAVKKHYADAGFDCDELTARSIVRQAR